MTSHFKEQELRQVLNEALRLLEGVAEEFWSSKIQKVLSVLDPPEVLSWFGGMGSFNDLLVAEINGHQVSRQQEREINTHLDELRRRIYEIAVELKAQEKK